jgi:tetratricopeptide (TPR) repeat protein
MISSRLNRAAAYEARRQPGDLEQALADTEAVLAAAPEWASGYNNRASIRLNMGGDDNLALALADLEKAIELNANLPEAYINRAYIYLRQNHSMAEVEPIVNKALELRPNYATAFNTLCWGYALEQQPKVALPYCQQAIEADPRPIFYDSRGLAHALLDNYPAARADFETYVTWLEAQPPNDTRQRELSRRRAWLEALAVNENPFTPELLAELRREVGQ